VERRVVRRQEGQFQASGLLLRRRAWQPSQPRSALIIVHDLCDHSGRLDGLGAWLAARDAAVHAYDQRGHGRSPGERGRVDNLAILVGDLDHFAEWVAEQHTGLPVGVIGLGVGAVVALRWLAQRKPDVAAAVVLGAPLDPAVATWPLPGRWRRALAALCPPRLASAPAIEPSSLSRDPQVVRSYREDPLVVRRVPVSTIRVVDEAVAALQGEIIALRIPIFVGHGEADVLCPVQGARRFHERLRGPGHRLALYPKLRHEILSEPERESVLHDLLDWFREKGL